MRNYSIQEFSGRGIVRSGNCPVGELSGRGIVRSGNCPVGVLSGRGIVRSGNCPVGELSIGELSGRGIVRSGNCPDTATFVLIAGGPRLLHVLHQTSGLPSLSTIYRIVAKENYLKGLKIIASTTPEISNLLKDNSKIIMANSNTQHNVISIKVDEIAVDKRLRYKSDSNEVVGFC